MWKRYASRHFQPGEGPSSGLLCDCKNRWIVCSWLLQFVIQNSGSEAAAAAAGGVFIAAKLKITSKSELNKLLENLDKYATLNPKV